MPNVMTLAEVRTECGIVSLVEDHKIQPWLNVAEATLEKILGRTGMASLRDDDTAAPWPTLLPFIKPYLAWQTFLLAVPSMHSQVTRNGWHVKGGTDGGETYDPIDPKTLGMNESSIRTAMETYMDRLIAELIAGNYAWYGTTVTGEERITSPSSVGISFRRSRWQNREGIPDNNRT